VAASMLALKMEHSLVLGQIFIDLTIAPALSSAINVIDVKLGCPDITQVEAAKNLRCLVNEKAKCASGGRKIQDIGAGQIWHRVAQN